MRSLRVILLLPLVGAALIASVFSLAWSIDGTATAAVGDPRLVHPSARMRLIMTRLQEGQAGAMPKGFPEAMAVLGLAPLEEEPFVLAALENYQAGRHLQAARLLEVARLRNPRSSEARYLAVDVALARRDIRGAVAELEALLRIAPKQSTLTQEALVLLASHPETSKAALGALESPQTKLMILAALARSGDNPEILIDALRMTRANEALEGNPAAVNSLAGPLVAAGHYEAAYRLWAQLQKGAPARPALVRDSGFDEALAPPFGWELFSTRAGYATRQAGDLAGETFGRTSGPVARQLLLLPAGAYRLELDIASANTLAEIALLCLPAAEIVSSRLDQAGPVLVDFEVPTDCRAQWLEIRARASDVSRAEPFRIRSIRISKDGL